MNEIHVIPTACGKSVIQFRLSPDTAGVLKQIVEEKAAELHSPATIVKYPVEFVDRVLSLASVMRMVSDLPSAMPSGGGKYQVAAE